jgi:UDP-2,4-diacetamido-2,4,6-trideoxy-beta-L-altropyranose hydrolase
LRVVEALQELDELAFELTVVLGASNRHRASVERAVSQSSHTARLLVNVSNMPAVMARSDLAISAGGGTCDELALLRVPMFLIAVAKNQEQTVEAYCRNRAAVTAGWSTVVDGCRLAGCLREVIENRKLRSELAERAGSMVDGNGAHRVFEYIRLVGTGATG